MKRQLVSSNSPYEPIAGFSRAVRVGNLVSVGGTAPIGNDGRTIATGDAKGQARRCFEIIGEALNKSGAGFKDVVRTRMLLTNIDDWEAIAQVHGEYFQAIRPVTTIVQVTRFINPEWLIEIEADAILSD